MEQPKKSSPGFQGRRLGVDIWVLGAEGAENFLLKNPKILTKIGLLKKILTKKILTKPERHFILSLTL